jgi:hypothetical protein
LLKIKGSKIGIGAKKDQRVSTLGFVPYGLCHNFGVAVYTRHRRNISERKRLHSNKTIFAH